MEIELPIDGTLDLHTFQPREVKPLVRDYLDECVARGIGQVRLIHGKGDGTLRRIVESVLQKHPRVVSWRHDGANWGVTLVNLTARAPDGNKR